MATKEQVQAAAAQLRDRQIAYKVLFGSNAPAVKTVMDDLAQFCRANVTTFDANDRVHAAMEGRREVYLRIQEHLEMPVSHFLASRLNINVVEKTDEDE